MERQQILATFRKQRQLLPLLLLAAYCINAIVDFDFSDWKAWEYQGFPSCYGMSGTPIEPQEEYAFKPVASSIPRLLQSSGTRCGSPFCLAGLEIECQHFSKRSLMEVSLPG
jgi:hypothetical protein